MRSLISGIVVFGATTWLGVGCASNDPGAWNRLHKGMDPSEVRSTLGHPHLMHADSGSMHWEWRPTGGVWFDERGRSARFRSWLAAFTAEKRRTRKQPAEPVERAGQCHPSDSCRRVGGSLSRCRRGSRPW